MFFFEEKLGLANRLKEIEACVSELRDAAKEYPLPDSVNDKIASLLQVAKI